MFYFAIEYSLVESSSEKYFTRNHKILTKIEENKVEVEEHEGRKYITNFIYLPSIDNK